MTGFGSQKDGKTTQKKRRKKNIDISEVSELLDGEALCKSAIAYHKRGDLANAERNYIKAIERGIVRYEIFINLGEIFDAKQQFVDSINLYKNSHYGDYLKSILD